MDGVNMGDSKAFSRIYHTYYRPLCYFAFSLTRDRVQAEDIVSESLSKLWQRRNAFDHEKQIKAFLYTTVRNASLNFLKSLQIRTQVHEQLLYKAEHKDDYVITEIIKAQLLNYIYDEVEKLPDRLRVVFEKIFIEGRSTSEIAEELDMPVQSVRNAKTRSLAILRQTLQKHGALTIFMSLAIRSL